MRHRGPETLNNYSFIHAPSEYHDKDRPWRLQNNERRRDFEIIAGGKQRCYTPENYIDVTEYPPTFPTEVERKLHRHEQRYKRRKNYPLLRATYRRKLEQERIRRLAKLEDQLINNEDLNAQQPRTDPNVSQPTRKSERFNKTVDKGKQI